MSLFALGLSSLRNFRVINGRLWRRIGGTDKSPTLVLVRRKDERSSQNYFPVHAQGSLFRNRRDKQFLQEIES